MPTFKKQTEEEEPENAKGNPKVQCKQEKSKFEEYNGFPIQDGK